jgi:DNA-binding PadR family transcriptional regulator
MTREMNNRDDLTHYQLDTLYVLAHVERASGKDILEALADERERPSESSHYEALRSLVELGLVTKRKGASVENEYSLTEDGRDLLAADLEMRERLLDLR